MAINGVMMQYFEWYLEPGFLWRQLKEHAGQLAGEGVTAVWIPPAFKGMAGLHDVGYSAYDLYDLGEFDQKGTVPTKYGSKEELISAIRALHDVGIYVYADIVLDHKMGADGYELVMAKDSDPNNRYTTVDGGDEIQIGAWTLFSFPGRKGAYSNFTWNWRHFDAVDWDEERKRSGLFLFEGKSWDTEVDGEKGNYDYLMGADLDLDNRDVTHELKRWGKWFLHQTDVDGFRFDAVKHIRFSFFKRWLKELRREEKNELFSVGEYWNADLQTLKYYLEKTGQEFSLFDVPLHYRFCRAATSNGEFDLRTIFDDTLTGYMPEKSVTFVDNHDTQPGQALESFVPAWFKPLAYALILLRQEGYPCVFYGDYYGVPHDNIHTGRDWLAPLLHARRKCSYGVQNDYFDDPDLIGWTREGDDDHMHSGLAAVITDGSGGAKTMYVGIRHANERFYDCTGGFAEHVTIGNDGCAVFHVHGGGLSVWIPYESCP
ncbi:MAG: alpha-amylase [Oscillospiraceae bacterium]|nr:alpha-amylase [Oscillospiraceae bacterium]